MPHRFATVALVVCLAGPMAVHAQDAKRFPQLTLETLTPEARPLGEEITKISSVGLAGPYNVMLRSPVMADRMKRLLDYLRFNNSLPPRLSEFAILIQGTLWKSNVEWYAHEPLALKAGLSKSVVEDLKAGQRPRDMKPDEAAVYDVTMDLAQKHAISDDRFAQAKAVLGEQPLVDLVAISGTYVTVAMLLALGDEQPPKDKPWVYPAGGTVKAVQSSSAHAAGGRSPSSAATSGGPTTLISEPVSR